MSATGVARWSAASSGRVEEASFIDLSPRAGWIHDVYVLGSARGEGLGERLLDRAVSALRGHGVREIMPPYRR